MKIVIERYVSPVVGMYRYDGTFIGEINNFEEFCKMQVQLVDKNLTRDYYFQWNDIMIELDEHGNMSSFPEGLYDTIQREMYKLWMLRKPK
jgi:hypothetical protein